MSLDLLLNSVNSFVWGPVMLAILFGAILATLFALFAVLSSFGSGNMTSAYSFASTVNMSFGIPTATTGAIITIVSLLIFMRGTRMIGNITSIMIPFASVFYCTAALIAISVNIATVPSGIAEILRAACFRTNPAWGLRR